MDLLFIFLIMFCGALLQGISGFGSGLIAVPLLTLLLPLTTLTPVLSLVNLVMALHLCWLLRSYLSLRQWLPMVVFGVLGSWLGSALLYFDLRWLQLGMAVLVLTAALLFWFGVQLQTRASRSQQALIGTVAGISNGALTLGGPPVVLFLTAQRLDRLPYRATLSFFFGVIAAANVLAFSLQHRYELAQLPLLATLLLAVISGAWLGHRLSPRLSEQRFRRLTLLLVMFAGLTALFRSLAL